MNYATLKSFQATALTAFCLGFTLFAGFAAAADSSTGFKVGLSQRNEARATAENVLKQLDQAGQNKKVLSDVFSNGADALSARYSNQSFAARIVQAKVPLGIMISRKYHGVDGGFTSLPNIIPGNYVIVKFDTDYGHGGNTYTEQVTLQLTPGTDNSWKYVEYYSAPEVQNPK